MDFFMSLSGEYSDTSSSETSSSNLISSSEVILASTKPKKQAGRRVFKETRHPVYRGVRRRNNNKWVCEMRIPNKNNKSNKSRIWLGTYPTPEMAARAHDVAALTLKGKSACLNFADSAWKLRLPESNDAVEIRRAAMEAAKLFAGEDGVVVDDMEDSKKNVLNVQVPVVTSEFEELHDLLLSIANEPLRSPPPSMNDYWGDMEIFDTPISLWNFSI
ncbi:dehydration-responsive element-binding protein 1E-like [Trifolium pratense]|nr:dehydration-responsive element-binding protein 1E-like [Trifolium pratense]